MSQLDDKDTSICIFPLSNTRSLYLQHIRYKYSNSISYSTTCIGNWQQRMQWMHFSSLELQSLFRIDLDYHKSIKASVNINVQPCNSSTTFYSRDGPNLVASHLPSLGLKCIFSVFIYGWVLCITSPTFLYHL